MSSYLWLVRLWLRDDVLDCTKVKCCVFKHETDVSVLDPADFLFTHWVLLSNAHHLVAVFIVIQILHIDTRLMMFV